MKGSISDIYLSSAFVCPHNVISQPSAVQDAVPQSAPTLKSPPSIPSPKDFQPPPVPSPKDTLPPIAQTPQTPSGPDLVPELMQKPKTGTLCLFVTASKNIEEQNSIPSPGKSCQSFDSMSGLGTDFLQRQPCVYKPYCYCKYLISNLHQIKA